MNHNTPRPPPDDTTADHLHSPVELIAQGEFGSVALCSCGHVHVNLQYITLRFEPEAFTDLVGLLSYAQQQLASNTRPESSH